MLQDPPAPTHGKPSQIILICKKLCLKFECKFLKSGKIVPVENIFYSPSGGDNMLSTRLSEIYQHLEAIEADKAPAKAAVILAGLGFTPGMQKMPTK